MPFHSLYTSFRCQYPTIDKIKGWYFDSFAATDSFIVIQSHSHVNVKVSCLGWLRMQIERINKFSDIKDRKMSEEIVFDCLHAEIVNYCLGGNKVTSYRNLPFHILTISC